MRFDIIVHDAEPVETDHGSFAMVARYELKMWRSPKHRRSKRLASDSSARGCPRWLKIALDALNRTDARLYAGEMPIEVARLLVDKCSSMRTTKFSQLEDSLIDRVIARGVAQRLA